MYSSHPHPFPSKKGRELNYISSLLEKGRCLKGRWDISKNHLENKEKIIL